MSDSNEKEPMEDEMEPTEDQVEATEDEPKIEESMANKPSGSCGALLATARNSKDLSVKDVAARLCLSVSRIEALETDDYASLPEETFTRGYIKSYAQLVDLDADLVLSYFPTSGSTTRKSPKMVIEPAEPLPKEGAGWPKIFVILISIAMIAYIVRFLQKDSAVQVDPTAAQNIQSESSQTSEDNSRTVNVLPLTEQATPSLANLGAEAASVADSNVTDNSQVVSTDVSVDVSTDAPSNTTASSSRTYDSNLSSPAGIFTSPSNSLENNSFEFGESDLTVDCSSAVWLDIRDKSGDKLFYRTCKGGEVISFNIGLPAAVFVGSIDGIELMLDNRAVDLTSYSNGLNYARFTLNAWSDNGVRPSSSAPSSQVQ